VGVKTRHAGGGALCYSFSYFVDQSFQFTSLRVIRVQKTNETGKQLTKVLG